MAPSSTTADSIVQAARWTIAQGGPEKLTLSAVASAAGVSRPTLYRWFATKADLLEALTSYEQQQFDAGLAVVIEVQRSPRRRLEAALRYLVTYLDTGTGPNSISADPAFALKSLNESLQPYATSLARLLGDALLEVPAVQIGALSKEQAAELILRMAYSHFLLPHPDPEVFLAMMCDFAQISRRAVRRIAG
jgi:AcrR family transcriptional regulator